jgi:hypothetical protein
MFTMTFLFSVTAEDGKYCERHSGAAEAAQEGSEGELHRRSTNDKEGRFLDGPMTKKISVSSYRFHIQKRL